MKQLEPLDNTEAYRRHPVSKEALVARVKLQMRAGLVDLNRLITQATVSRHIVVQFIRMWRDAGHPEMLLLEKTSIDDYTLSIQLIR